MERNKEEERDAENLSRVHRDGAWVRPCVERIGRFDADLARQLKKASTSVALNVAEGSGSRGGKRRHCYDIALGEAREVAASLEVAAAIGYLPGVDAGLRRQLNQIIGTLVNIIR